MASGISSALGYYLIGKQPSKGTPPVTWFKFRACGEPSIAPDKEVKRFTMTDSSRDRGDAYTSVVSVKGDLPVYCHPNGMGLLTFLALGSDVDSGAGPYTHSITPADDLPWCSVFRVVGNVITERFVDCKLDTLKLEASAGEAPEATLGFIGITPTWMAEPSSTAIVDSPYIYWEGKNLLNISGTPYPWSDFMWSINNNLLPYQADDYFLNDVDPGKREIDFNFTMHFSGPTNEPKYREFIYGSDVGTTVGTGLVAKSIDFKWLRDANNSFKIAMPQARYAAVPVNPNPSGEPIEVKVETVVERPSGSPICTATVIDTLTTVG